MGALAESLTSVMPAGFDHTDPELLAHALRGREEHFTELYQRRQGGVYRFALQMSGSAALAEDVTQETFLTLLQSGDRYDAARGSVAAFLYGIARNLVMRRLERDRRYEPEEDSTAEGDLLEDLTRSQSIERVRQAVLSLPPVYREAVVLCDLQETSYEEAAAALDCPVGTIRSRLNRARGMLARKLCGTANAVRSIE
jgi:RNA polymerase sigma-70 factor (ECF subfamily)